MDNKVYVNIPYKSGYSYSVIKLERKLFDDENKFYDENIYKYFLSEFYSEPFPIPNPQSPIPNPQSPFIQQKLFFNNYFI